MRRCIVCSPRLPRTRVEHWAMPCLSLHCQVLCTARHNTGRIANEVKRAGSPRHDGDGALLLSRKPKRPFGEGRHRKSTIRAARFQLQSPWLRILPSQYAPSKRDRGT
jgi:hypothetical protein